MDVFAFQSQGGASMSPSEWLTTWSSEFDTARYPEDVYQELVAKATELSDADFDVLGAWKDGAVRHGAKVKFGNCSVSFTGSWKPNAVAAYTVWRNLPQIRSALRQYLDREEYCSFLNHLSKERFKKVGRNHALVDAQFGLSRATYVLHVFSGAKFPIYDRNTHAGIHFLTQGRYRKTKTTDPEWYLGTFCTVVHDLQEACAARDLPSQRKLDKALFCYGKAKRAEQIR